MASRRSLTRSQVFPRRHRRKDWRASWLVLDRFFAVAQGRACLPLAAAHYYRAGVADRWEQMRGHLDQISVSSSDGAPAWGLPGGYIFYRPGASGKWWRAPGPQQSPSSSSSLSPSSSPSPSSSEHRHRRHRSAAPSSSSSSSASSSSPSSSIASHHRHHRRHRRRRHRRRSPSSSSTSPSPRSVCRLRRKGLSRATLPGLAAAAASTSASTPRCLWRGGGVEGLQIAWHWRSSPRWPCAALRHFSVAQTSNRTFGFCWWHAALGVPRKAGRGTLARASEPATAQ